MKKKCLLAFFSALLALNSGCSYQKNNSNEEPKTNQDSFNSEESEMEELITEDLDTEIIDTEEIIPEPIVQDVLISAVGDCTLGTDTNFGYERSFTSVLDANNRDFSYFFSGVYDVLSNDDLTIANLETTFTDATVKNEKTFNFKGDFDYTNILTEGSVEAVNLANNHTYDYLEKGYTDTINALESASIPYFGYDDYSILDINGIKVGMAGITGWSEESAKTNTTNAINYFHENKTDLIILSYHWGIEREYVQNSVQESIARYAIDEGADLVLGHHPHVLQGIETYKGKQIVYSLGNFVFGGNKNPSDKDTMIFQQNFHFVDGVLTETTVNIIPCSLSSRTDLNDYKPIILEEGEEKERVLKKVLDSSKNFDY